MANYTDLNYNDTASSVSTNEANLNSQQKPNATDEGSMIFEKLDMILEEHRAQNKMLDDENKKINEALRLIDQEEEILKRSIEKYELLGSLGRQIPPQHARPPPSYPRPATNDSTQRSTLARTPGNNLTRSRSTSQQRYCQVVHRPTSAHVSYKRSTQVHTAPYRTRRQNTAPSPLPLCPKGFNFTPRSSSYSPRKDVPPFPISTYKPQNNFVPLSSIYMSHDLTLPAVSHSKSPINNSTSTLQPPVRYSTSFDFGSAQVPASTANAQDTTGSFGSL